MNDGQALFTVGCVLPALLYFLIHGIIATIVLGGLWGFLAIIFGVAGIVGIAYGLGAEQTSISES